MTQETTPFLTFAKPSIGEEEIAAVAEVMRSGWLTTGPRTREFEDAFAAATGAKHALAVNSATAALHLGMEALGVSEGDIVLTPTWSFTSSAEVPRYLGAHPYFVDVEPDTLNIDPIGLEKAIDGQQRRHGSKLRAIAPVHFAGQACEMDKIIALAADNGLKVIEDAAHAYPTSVFSASVSTSESRERIVGTVGHATAFSFYATKTLATGEGGMLTTESDAVAARARIMRLHGISRDVWNRYTSTKPSWYYEIVAAGYKYNLTDIASAIGMVQLSKADKLWQQRQAIATAYNEAFGGHWAFEIPVQRHTAARHAWHLYVLRLNLDTLSIDREAFIQEMANRGIGCSVHFIPLHMQPYWRDFYQLDPDQFPNANREFPRTLSLPIWPDMSTVDVARVCDAALAIAAAHRR